MMHDDDGLEGTGGITPPQPPEDFLKEALGNIDTRMSVLISYYNDGTIEYSVEYDHEHYGENLPLEKVIGLLYHATETIISNSRGDDND